jgi:hypothetical protein
MALLGVIGGPLLAASGIAVLLGVIPQFGAVQGIATIPEIVWEAFLGLWLTFKGFKAAAPAALAFDSRAAEQSATAAPGPMAVATKAAAA